jgi:hypothetical protein
LLPISLCIDCAKNTQNIAGNKKTDLTTEDFRELSAKAGEIDNYNINRHKNVPFKKLKRKLFYIL